MDLIVKVKSYRNLDNYIKMGANAFLFGIKDFSINSLTNLNIRKLKKIKDKYKNIKIYISVDKNMFNKDLDKLTKFLINVDNLNLDGIFFYDLGIYYIKEKYNFKTPLVWNQNYFVNNYETCNYYYSKGIKYGVGCILIFTGIKLLLLFFNITIPTLLSLIIILIILLISILLSLVF